MDRPLGAWVLDVAAAPGHSCAMAAGDRNQGKAWRRRGATLGLSALGVAVFWALSVPLPFLLGPMFACLVASLSGVALVGTPRISEAMRTVLGLAVGASITPAFVAQLGGMMASIALVPVFVAAIGAVGYPYFRRVCGFDPATSYYAAMPGGLQDMLAFGEEAGGDVRALSLIHATRVLIVVSVLPFFLTLAMGLELNAAPGAPAAELPWIEGVAMVAIAFLGWRGAQAVGLFGASILGPMALAAVASLVGILHFRPPAEAILIAQFFLGLGVGVKYRGLTVAELRRTVAAGVGYVGLTAVISVVFAGAVALLGFAPFVEAILAFAPGGQGEMVVIAIVAGVDVAFVVAHHLTRLVVVIVGAPLAGRFLR